MTMSLTNVASEIRGALAKLPGREFSAAATDLLGIMGYRSNLVPDSQPATVDDFIQQYPAPTPGTRAERALREAVESIHILFQFTDQEITAQGSLFSAAFDTGNARSFLFAAVELKQASYPRGDYATFAREINKRWQIPTVVLFRTASDLLTLAFVHRRPNRRDPDRDVLGSVSLIREIRPSAPHRAHLDILSELSLVERLSWISWRGQSRNFDGLLAAWLAALDTEELNRRFYRELLRWFDRAVQPEFTRFPTAENKVISPQEHVIRLITRMLFIWFIKEKGLVAPELLMENQVAPLLKDYDRSTGESYYRAVLQNLFFATLNTEIDRRGFSRESNPTHRDFTRYRFRSEMTDPDALFAHFARTPFINGGLFDCLDSEEAKGKGGYRIDCFSDVDKGLLSIPNRLFFGPDGLIDLFERYKFTVEENTPVEVEVALDPELLGKVFENLLAAYNPETKESARKQTGSYYTPRAVVDYMVDEALVAALAQKAAPDDGDRIWWEDRFHYLLDYSDAGDLFLPDEADRVVRSIAELRVLDPAVGSGAFPMGVLHKLTLALRRLDSDNRRWEALQRDLALKRTEKAYGAATQQQRDQALQNISDTFERYRGSDFGRKLYLIQNSIYGVDIQPVATQIAKLRFFISLAIEQQPAAAAENYGIQPLPNLETRFVAADTLLGLDNKAVQVPLGGENRVSELNDELRQNRERHFHAGIRQEKLRLRREDARLRDELATELEGAGMSKSDAGKIASWDPYDQNAHAEWFDAGYMFDIRDGFDVVIGNPPYVQLQKDGGRLGRLYRDCGYAAFASTGDVYQLFYERGCQLLTSYQGTLAYITSNSWLKAEYGKSLRGYFTERHTPIRLLELGKDVFESVIVDASILLLRAGKSADAPSSFPAVDTDRLHDKAFPPAQELWGQVRLESDAPWSILSLPERSVLDKMRAKGTPLKEWDIAINYGIKTGFNDAFIIDNQTKDALIAEDPKSVEVIKPVLRGRDIQRYQAQWKGLWLIATFPALDLNIDDYPAVKRHLLSFGKRRLEQSGKRLPNGERSRKKTSNTWFEMQDTCAYHEDFTKEKLLWIELVNNGRFAYDNSGFYGEATTFLLTGESIKYLCAVLNTKLIRWFLEKVAPTSGMGTLRWKKVYVERLPIPRINAARQQPFSRLVDIVLMAKAGDRDSDTSETEAEIDARVYQLYGLTPSEITAVEQRF